MCSIFVTQSLRIPERNGLAKSTTKSTSATSSSSPMDIRQPTPSTRSHLPQVLSYFGRDGQSDDGLMKLLIDFNVDEEFLVMIVEHVDGSGKQAVSVHKITRVGLS